MEVWMWVTLILVVALLLMAQELRKAHLAEQERREQAFQLAHLRSRERRLVATITALDEGKVAGSLRSRDSLAEDLQETRAELQRLDVWA